MPGLQAVLALVLPLAVLSKRSEDTILDDLLFWSSSDQNELLLNPPFDPLQSVYTMSVVNSVDEVVVYADAASQYAELSLEVSENAELRPPQEYETEDGHQCVSRKSKCHSENCCVTSGNNGWLVGLDVGITDLTFNVTWDNTSSTVYEVQIKRLNPIFR